MTKKNLLIAPFIMVPLFASCKAEVKYGVFVNCNEVTINKDVAVKGQDFVAEIAIKPEVLETGGYALPPMPERIECVNRILVEGDYTYTLKENETKADITIPAKYIEGITNIYLSVFECKVSEDEFNNAINFTDVSYAQTEIKRTFENPSTKKKVEDSLTQDFSPTGYHGIDISEGHKLANEALYSERYVAKKEKDIKELTRSSPKVSWDNIPWTDAKEFPTPASEIGGEIQMALTEFKLEFSDFVYKNNVYTVSEITTEMGRGTLILTFNKKLLINFDFVIDPIEIEELVPVGEEITCDYEEFEIEFPKDPFPAI